MMPKIAEGSANKVWIVPSEIGRALEGLGSTMSSMQGIPDKVDGPRTRVDMGPSEPVEFEDSALSTTHQEVAAAIAAAEASSDLRARPSQAPAAVPADGGTPGTGSSAASREVSTDGAGGDPGEPSAQ
jgi:hypothetical protein